ncbi:MAG: cysteine--tRNA ligase [Candidatus Lokiarchaeota archaeon]|nr:cysteine--tRNA ligase [Candidatus Lokiarchaeota archaeon]
MNIYNSLTFQKEEFHPLDPNNVLMYVCGPTVYDSPHLGHAKSAIVFDLVRRYLKFKGYTLKVVKNYTDIDDKIIKRANERNIDFNDLSEQYINEYEEMMALLNVQKDDLNPRATESIQFIIDFIHVLIRKEFAYEKNGSVYFSVKKFPKYLEIFQNEKKMPSEENNEDEEAHEDQDSGVGEDKEDKRDFALWKAWKEGEPFWNSPWGKGRPGWHIECSAMVVHHLGETIDIHGGGQDLKFPHHRNELAQAEAYTGKKFANYFMHNGFVNVNDEKMSKSLGNFFLVSDVVKQYDPMVIRFFLLSSHYRKSINYSRKTMNGAKKNYEKIVKTISTIGEIIPEEFNNDNTNMLLQKLTLTKKVIFDALDDDFNTPVAFAAISVLVREINNVIIEKDIKISAKTKNDLIEFFQILEEIFGMFPNLDSIIKRNEKALLLGEKANLINELLDLLKYTRRKLREKKIYDLSDEIRERLSNLGFSLEDK